MQQIIIGQLIATAFAILLIFLGEWLQRKRDRAKELAAMKSQRTQLAKALHAELGALTNRYESNIGHAIVAAKVWSDLGTATVSEGYFTVFDQNADKVGLFDDLDAKAIIDAYVIGRVHLDNVRGWSRRINELNQNRIMAHAAHKFDLLNELNSRARDKMPKLLELLKKDSETFLKGFSDAQAALQKYF